MASRYQCSLPSDVLEKAIKDLNEPENIDKRLESIDNLKARFKEKCDKFELLDESDEFLLRFLRSCEFDLEYSLKTLECYHKIRSEWREVFDLVENKKNIRKSFASGPPIFWGGRAKDGSFILLQRPGLGNSLAKLIASVFLSYEKMIENEEAQIFGITVIVDLSHLGFRMGMQMASIGKRFLRMLQEVLPIRIKSINIVNEAYVFDAMFAIVSNFMSSHIKQKMRFHRHNLHELHESIDANSLPPFLGGTGQEIDIEEWTREVIDT
ncbi:alpha-tocopherol transfer protein-like isoform X1 [Styela clava]